MKQPIKKIAYGSATIFEAIICFAKAHSAADFMYYVCRVFVIALPLQVAIALRTLLLTTAESIPPYILQKSRVVTRDFCVKVRFVFRSFVYLHKTLIYGKVI